MQRLLIIFVFLVNMIVLKGQGCSDAGACSVGALGLKTTQQEIPQLGLEYGQTVGLADKESLVFATELALSHNIAKTTQLQVRIPYTITVGNLGSTSGVGDLFVTLTQKIYSDEHAAVLAVAGSRLKTNDANKKLNGNPLPMVYQSSLGTNDLILGLAWQSKAWSISAAYQHAFGNNLNEYLHPEPGTLPDNKLYYESAFLKRGDDLMLRLQRTQRLNDANTIRFGFLPVFRMQPDQIKRNDVYEELPGSKGFTYNLFFNWDREIIPGKTLTFTIGFPLHAREYRADGLTRTVVAGVGLNLGYYKKKSANPPINTMIDSLKTN